MPTAPENPEPTEDHQAYHRRLLQAAAKKKDIAGLLACLVHDVNAHHTRVVNSLIVLGLEHPEVANTYWVQTARESADNLRELIWFYFELLAPLVKPTAPPDTPTQSEP